jgi:hypothetical protein
MDGNGQESVKERKAKGSEIATGIVGSICLFAVAYFLLSSNHGIWATLVLLFGLGVLAHGFISRNTAACPNCKHQFDDVDSVDRWILCPSCEKYLEIKTAETGLPSKLEIIDDNYICEDLIFNVKVPRGNYFPMWPTGCCICGKPTEGRGVTEHKLVSHGTVAVQTMKFSVDDIPYCREHYIEYSEKNSVGVRLIPRFPDSKRLISPEDGGPHVLAFRSYKYFRAFRALNGW